MWQTIGQAKPYAKAFRLSGATATDDAVATLIDGPPASRTRYVGEGEGGPVSEQVSLPVIHNPTLSTAEWDLHYVTPDGTFLADTGTLAGGGVDFIFFLLGLSADEHLEIVLRKDSEPGAALNCFGNASDLPGGLDAGVKKARVVVKSPDLITPSEFFDVLRPGPNRMFAPLGPVEGFVSGVGAGPDGGDYELRLVQADGTELVFPSPGVLAPFEYASAETALGFTKPKEGEVVQARVVGKVVFFISYLSMPIP